MTGSCSAVNGLYGIDFGLEASENRMTALQYLVKPRCQLCPASNSVALPERGLEFGEYDVDQQALGGKLRDRGLRIFELGAQVVQPGASAEADGDDTHDGRNYG